MEVRRTASIKLIIPDGCRDDFHESARQFLHCANRAAEFCWSDICYTECITANTTARDALYEKLREETDLTANLVQEAIRRAVQATKGCVERWKQGRRVQGRRMRCHGETGCAEPHVPTLFSDRLWVHARSEP